MISSIPLTGAVYKMAKFIHLLQKSAFYKRTHEIYAPRTHSMSIMEKRSFSRVDSTLASTFTKCIIHRSDWMSTGSNEIRNESVEAAKTLKKPVLVRMAGQ